ncbi:hypothetical protein ACFX15_021145 [Malus domestica]
MPRTVIKQPPPRNKESGDSNNLQQPPCRSQLESTDDNANKGKQTEGGGVYTRVKTLRTFQRKHNRVL